MGIFYSKLDIIEEKVSELEDRSEENTHNGTQSIKGGIYEENKK